MGWEKDVGASTGGVGVGDLLPPRFPETRAGSPGRLLSLVRSHAGEVPRIGPTLANDRVRFAFWRAPLRSGWQPGLCHPPLWTSPANKNMKKHGGAGGGCTHALPPPVTPPFGITPPPIRGSCFLRDKQSLPIPPGAAGGVGALPPAAPAVCQAASRLEPWRTDRHQRLVCATITARAGGGGAGLWPCAR